MGRLFGVSANGGDFIRQDQLRNWNKKIAQHLAKESQVKTDTASHAAASKPSNTQTAPNGRTYNNPQVERAATRSQPAASQVDLEAQSVTDLSAENKRAQDAVLIAADGSEKEAAQERAAQAKDRLNQKVEAERKGAVETADKTQQEFDEQSQQLRSYENTASWMGAAGYGVPRGQRYEHDQKIEEARAAISDPENGSYVRNDQAQKELVDADQRIQDEIDAGIQLANGQSGVANPETVANSDSEALQAQAELAEKSLKAAQDACDAGTDSDAQEGLENAVRFKAEADANVLMRQEIEQKTFGQLGAEEQAAQNELDALVESGAPVEERQLALDRLNQAKAKVTAKRAAEIKTKEDAVTVAEKDYKRAQQELTPKQIVNIVLKGAAPEEMTNAQTRVEDAKGNLQAKNQEITGEINSGRLLMIEDPDPLTADEDAVANTSMGDLETNAEQSYQAFQDAEIALIEGSDPNALENYKKAERAAHQDAVNLGAKLEREGFPESWREEIRNMSPQERLQARQEIVEQRNMAAARVDPRNPQADLTVSIMENYRQQQLVAFDEVIVGSDPVAEELKAKVASLSQSYERTDLSDEERASIDAQIATMDNEIKKRTSANVILAVDAVRDAYGEGGLENAIAASQVMQELEMTTTEARATTSILDEDGTIAAITSEVKSKDILPDQYANLEGIAQPLDKVPSAVTSDAMHVVSGLGRLTYLAQDEDLTTSVAQTLTSPVNTPDGLKSLNFDSGDFESILHFANDKMPVKGDEGYTLSRAGIQSLGLISVTAQTAKNSGAELLEHELSEAARRGSERITQATIEHSDAELAEGAKLGGVLGGTTIFAHGNFKSEVTGGVDPALLGDGFTDIINDVDPNWQDAYLEAQRKNNASSVMFLDAVGSVAYLQDTPGTVVNNVRNTMAEGWPAAAASEAGEAYMDADVSAMGDDDPDTVSIVETFARTRYRGSAEPDEFDQFLGKMSLMSVLKWTVGSAFHTDPDAVMEHARNVFHSLALAGVTSLEGAEKALGLLRKFRKHSNGSTAADFFGDPNYVFKYLTDSKNWSQVLWPEKKVHENPNWIKFKDDYNRKLSGIKIGIIASTIISEDWIALPGDLMSWKHEDERWRHNVSRGFKIAGKQRMVGFAPANYAGAYTLLTSGIPTVTKELHGERDVVGLTLAIALAVSNFGAAISPGPIAGGLIVAGFILDTIYNLYVDHREQMRENETAMEVTRRTVHSLLQDELLDPASEDHTQRSIEILVDEELAFPKIMLLYSSLSQSGQTGESFDEFISRVASLDHDDLREFCQLTNKVEVVDGKIPHTRSDDIYVGKVATNFLSDSDDKVAKKIYNQDGTYEGTAYFKPEEVPAYEDGNLEIFVANNPGATINPGKFDVTARVFRPNSAQSVVDHMDKKGVNLLTPYTAVPDNLPQDASQHEGLGVAGDRPPVRRSSKDLAADSRYAPVRVEKGQSLWEICKKNGADFNETLRVNRRAGHIGNINALEVDDVIYLALEPA